jgi:cobalt-zinc-cadmium efflux system membrane fusion protein
MTYTTNHRLGADALTRQWVWLIALLFAAGCRSGTAEGAPAKADAEPAGGAITQWTDSTELFMEHPALIVGAPDKFAVHLTDLTDFAPLRSGKITLRFVPRGGGAPVLVTQDAPRSPGIYGPSPEFKQPGVYDLTILVESPQARDSIAVPALTVYASAAEAPKEEGGGDPGIPFLKEQQWKTPGFATEFATTGSVATTVDATGEIIPAAGRYADVSAPISGLVDAGSVARSPAPGQRVQRGQVLAILMPSLGEAGGSSYAEARATLREAQDEYDRAKRLFAAEAVPERRVHEAEIRLQAAREALAGLTGGGAASENGQLAIRAPISGVVANRTIAPGSRVDAGAPLFSIVDPSVVWLRVNVPAADAPRVRATSGATFRVERLPREYTATRTVSVGSIIDSLSRTVPVIYEVANSDGSLKIGGTARVGVRTGERAAGVVVPTAAVLDEDGRPIAYVQAEGERFEKRELTIGGRDRDRTLVLSGIQRGDRVVTGAAYQVRLASLSTAVPAHGHEH